MMPLVMTSSAGGLPAILTFLLILDFQMLFPNRQRDFDKHQGIIGCRTGVTTRRLPQAGGEIENPNLPKTHESLDCHAQVTDVMVKVRHSTCFSLPDHPMFG